MSNFDFYFTDEDREASRPEPKEVKCGKATQEELEAAFDEIFKNEWRKNK